MKVLIIRGKWKGMEVQIRDWRNDWFATEEVGILSPTQIAFNGVDLDELRESDCGFLFKRFQLVFKECGNSYCWVFRKRKMKKEHRFIV